MCEKSENLRGSRNWNSGAFPMLLFFFFNWSDWRGGVLESHNESEGKTVIKCVSVLYHLVNLMEKNGGQLYAMYPLGGEL